MPTIDISRYFSNDGWVRLSKPCRKLPLTDAKQYFNYVSPSSLIAGTVTIGNKEVLKKDYYEKCYILEKKLKEYSGHNKKTKYIAFMEDTKVMTPHLHLLIYNGYTCNFDKTFGPLGQRNKNKESFKPVSNLKSYLEYITKEHSPNNDNKYYTNITIEDIEYSKMCFNKRLKQAGRVVVTNSKRGATLERSDHPEGILTF